MQNEKIDLKSRHLPPLKSREEMMEIIDREVFGYLPSVDYTLSFSEPEVFDLRYNCGEVEGSFVDMTVTVGKKSHTIEIGRLLHTDKKKRPLVVLCNFHKMTESHYFPIEELSEYDCDYLVVKYTDISSDDGDFLDGLAPLILPNGQESDHSCGKIAIWAWGCMRVVDYALTLEGTDKDFIAIAGHSRLGKCALYTAMHDTRIALSFSNASGCTGSALNRGNSGFFEAEEKRGELISDIVRVFPFWFCKNYLKYAEANIPGGFDQHYLVGSIAPRYVAICSCDLDYWADPKSEQACALASSEAWERLGARGLVNGEDYIENNNGLLDGNVAYFKIHSKHFLSRHSWKWLMKFIEKKHSN